MDLGYKVGGPGQVATAPSEPEEKTLYPSFSIRDKAVEEFLKEHKLKKDDEFTATVELRLSGWHDDQYDRSLSFDVKSLEVKSKRFEDKSPKEQFAELHGEASEKQEKDAAD